MLQFTKTKIVQIVLSLQIEVAQEQLRNKPKQKILPQREDYYYILTKV